MKKMGFLSVLILLVILLILPVTGINFSNFFTKSEVQTEEFYKPKDFSKLLSVKGFNTSLLKMHLRLYNGYVTNSNFLLGKIKCLINERLEDSKECSELKKRYGYEFDGMRLHECYFENLGGIEPINQESDLFTNLSEQFGSYEKWQKDFQMTGNLRGIGWVVLYLDPDNGRLSNKWLKEKEVNHLASGIPILVMDVFEHSYLQQFGVDKDKYILEFFKNINWDVVQDRYVKVKK